MDETFEPPTGGQYELSWGNQRATVVEVGGALRAYSVGGRDVVDGYGADERCTGGRGQPLIPWPNRLRDGRYSFGGEDFQVPLNEPEKANAIHGLVRWANWRAVEQAGDRVTMEHVLHPSPGYPFTVSLRIEYVLGAEGLAVRIGATNRCRSACPYGAGAHPYLTLGTGTIDPLVLRAPGARRLLTDDRQIPVSSEPVDGTSYDFRSARTLGDAVLDTAYGDLERASDGRATVVLATRDGSRQVGLWMDTSARYLMLFTGDTLGQPEHRRRGLGVEPMTCAPNAFVTGEGLQVLEPGQASSLAWGISPSGVDG